MFVKQIYRIAIFHPLHSSEFHKKWLVKTSFLGQRVRDSNPRYFTYTAFRVKLPKPNLAEFDGR